MRSVSYHPALSLKLQKPDNRASPCRQLERSATLSHRSARLQLYPAFGLTVDCPVCALCEFGYEPRRRRLDSLRCSQPPTCKKRVRDDIFLFHFQWFSESLNRSHSNKVTEP